MHESDGERSHNIYFSALQYNPNNGSLEAVRDCFMSLDNVRFKSAEIWADWLLSELWLHGFTIKIIEIDS